MNNRFLLSQKNVRTLRDRCTDMICRVACIDDIREEVILPILEYYAESDNEVGVPLYMPQDSVQLAWSMLRHGALLCMLVNTYRTGLVEDFTLLNGVVEAESFLSADSKRNIDLYINACRNELYMGDAQLFPPEKLFTDDTNALAKAVDSANSMMERIMKIQFLNFEELIPELCNRYSVINAEEISEADLRRSPDEAIRTNKRLSALNELLGTEKRFNADLEALQKYAQEVRIEDVLKEEEFEAIFGNLDLLVDFQRQFLFQMESRLTSAVLNDVEASYSANIGELFIENEDGFKVYEGFCANHPKALETAQSVSKRLASVGADLNVLVIGSYLTKPVQRICRYPLLLKELIKCSESGAPDLGTLVTAQKVMDRVAHNVNAAKGREEEARRIDSMKLFGLSSEQLGVLLAVDEITLDNNEAANAYFYENRIIMITNPSLSTNKAPDGMFLRRKKSPMRDSVTFRIIINTSKIISAGLEADGTVLKLNYKDEMELICNQQIIFRTAAQANIWGKRVEEIMKKNASPTGIVTSAIFKNGHENLVGSSGSFPVKIEFNDACYITIVELPIRTVEQMKKNVANRLNSHYRVLDEPWRVSTKDMALSFIDSEGDEIAIAEDNDARYAHLFCKKYMHMKAKATIRNIRRNKLSMASIISIDSTSVRASAESLERRSLILDESGPEYINSTTSNTTSPDSQSSPATETVVSGGKDKELENGAA